ncbi:DUF5320 domain-containing protein [Clostridium formicaceticum]|uniref:DUF5320 domain-containing protein n=1 Tax=Clostridium formicaceticum TaxID=1497 RepID=A0AAC9RNM4_9CLOT|nr:DUF5320 domain-containing protein [Clostridium formicaceticum]AOY74565.1 hypothetical protein BJL90_00495 [Clostridium formicaceticum]ARE88922.1 hypothetical protein CLFO_33280 [Clostridium formicaceticum]
MPRRDGTGPMGVGTINEIGLGGCINASTFKYDVGLRIHHRFGFGCRRGFGRHFLNDENNLKTQKNLLLEQKELLKSRLNAIDKQLEGL